MTAEPLATFKAICRGAKLDAKGEVCLDIVVPKEEKYNCLPVTDNGHIMMTFIVHAVRADSFMDNEILEGFVLPEGAAMGDGTGERTYRGGYRESDDLREGKIVPDRNQYHTKAY